MSNEDNKWEILEELMNLRFEFLFNHAIDGFDMDSDTALELLRNFNNGLTDIEKKQREILVAAVDNLIDFAVAEEFQMSDEIDILYERYENNEIDRDEFENDSDKVCNKYNSTYAKVENDDVTYAMYMASVLYGLTDNTYLTYMTMGDERVRPWHLALEGTTYPKKDFPAWMVPPIEHNCRCFLITSNDVGASMIDNVMAKADKLEMPSFVDPTFKECVAFGGRIFSDEHSYFSIPIQYKDKLNNIAHKLKVKYHVEVD